MSFISFNLIFMNKYKFLYIILCLSILFGLNSCGLYKKTDVKDTPVSVDERVKKNIQEGRGIRFGKGATRGGDFDFASSNPLWRASLEIIDFMPLSTVDYSGGVIITDWYSDGSNSKESIKITIRFLSNEVRSDSIKIIVHNKKCNINENCGINEIDTKLKFELQKSILTKAANLDLEKKDKK